MNLELSLQNVFFEAKRNAFYFSVSFEKKSYFQSISLKIVTDNDFSKRQGIFHLLTSITFEFLYIFDKTFSRFKKQYFYTNFLKNIFFFLNVILNAGCQKLKVRKGKNGWSLWMLHTSVLS